MVNYWDRLKPEMDAHDMDITKLAKAMGISFQAVAKVRDGGSFGTENNIKAAKLLGLNSDWLACGKGPKISGAQGNVDAAPELRKAKGVPVVGEVKGGVDGYLEETQYPVGHGDGEVDYPTTDANAYALKVRGDSMHPRYRAGEFIVVEPGIEATPSDDVVVGLTDGRKLLKELNWMRDGEIQLLSVNNHYAPLTIQLDSVKFIHLVAGRVRRNGLKRK